MLSRVELLSGVRAKVLTGALIAAWVLVVTWSGCVQAQEAVNKTVRARPDGTVEIESLTGSITVSGWDRGEIEVRGTLGREAESLDIESDGGRVHIEVRASESRGRGSWPMSGANDSDANGTRLEIRVPAASRVEVQTVAAEIIASGLEGDLELESVSGRVRVGGRPAGLEVVSVSGAIEVESAPPDTELETVSSRIEVQEAVDDLEAGSVSGSIHLAGGAIRSGTFETVSGDIRIESALEAGGTLKVETMSGAVTLVASADQAADYHLETFSGEILCELGAEAKRSAGGSVGRSLDISVGSGGARVRVSSFNGAVRLLRR